MIELLLGPVKASATAPKARACQSGALPAMPHSSTFVPRTPAFRTSAAGLAGTTFEATM